MKDRTAQIILPKLSFSFQVLVVLVLFVGIVTIISSYNLANNPPVYFKVLSGEVTTSDGNTYPDARDGKKIPLNVRTQIKTDSRVASIQLWNGSVVILDSDSSIEFNRPNENEPEMSFAFNLLKGKVLVVNEKKGLIPVRIFIGSNFIVQASKSAMGLEVFAESNKLNEVDCLFGKCLVNGVHLLMTGQNAQIGPGQLIQVTEGAAINDWISLWKAGNLKPELKNQLVSFMPTSTPTIIQTLPFVSTDQPSLTPGSKTLIYSPTPLLIVSQNMTLSRTIFTFPSPTITPSRTIIPFRFPTFTKTLSRENDPGPSRTQTPSLTPVPQATPRQTLTPTLFPTNTPTPSSTSSPSATSTPVLTATPTESPKTPKPPTKTTAPPFTPPNTPEPTTELTSTTTPTATPTATTTPTATEVPPPTPTEEDD